MKLTGYGLDTTLTYDQLMEIGDASHSGSHFYLNHTNEPDIEGFKHGEHYNVMEWHIKVNKSFCQKCCANVRRMEKEEPLVYSYKGKISPNENGKWIKQNRNPDGTWTIEKEL